MIKSEDINRDCHWCHKPEDARGDHRPYGPGGAWVCFTCGTSPEHEADMEAMIKAVFVQAIQTGATSLVVGGPDGVVPGYGETPVVTGEP